MILDTERGADVRYGGIAPKESQKLAEEINRAGGRLHILVHPFYRLSSASKGYRRSLQRVLTVVPEVPVVIAECVRDPDDARDDRWMQRLQRNFAALNANWESVGCIPFEANHPSPKFSAIPFDQEREPYLAHLWEHR